MTASSGFSQGHKHPGASPLWADPAVAVGGEAVSAAPRDVASMKAEIAEIQSDTTQSLDRAIAAAQATTGVGNHVSEELQEQREQMGRIDADVRDADTTLKRTGYNIKHGFTWRGALTSPFRRGVKKPPGRGTLQDIAPVFTDDYQATQSSNSKSPKGGKSKPSAAGPSHGGAKTEKNGKGKPSADSSNNSNQRKPPSAGHVPEGFDEQLDVLDGLMDGLAAQANAIGDELRQQNEGVEVLGDRIESVAEQTSSQSKQIKRRFRVRG